MFECLRLYLFYEDPMPCRFLADFMVDQLSIDSFNLAAAVDELQ